MKQRSENPSSSLETVIAERLKQRLHPLIPTGTGWRVWPPAIADILSEPAHIISISQKACYVDGLAVDSAENLEKKLYAARRAIWQVYRIPIRENGGFTNHLGVRFRVTLGSGEVSLPGLGRYSKDPSKGIEQDWSRNPFLLEMITGPSAWQLLVCIPQPPSFSRVVFKAKRVCPEPSECYPDRRFITYLPTTRNKEICASLAFGDQSFKEILVSQDFFEKPTPENAKFFGDLCFLSQASSGWRVSREILFPAAFESHNIPSELDLFGLIFRLSTTKGFENLLQTAYLQLLLKDKHVKDWAFWHMFTRLAEEVIAHNTS